MEGKLKPGIKALILRTLPNSSSKLEIDYSDTNPPFIDENAISLLVETGIEHLLVDLPSVDKEKDDGLLKSHHAFWQTDSNLRESATITEFIFVRDEIEDGLYFLNLQIAPMELDASPSKPILYKITDQS